MFVKFSVSMGEPPMPTHQGELCLLKLSGCGTRTFLFFLFQGVGGRGE